MFHSFYHVGLMQHVAGKHVFDSACTHEHTNRQNICRLLLKLFSGHCRHHFGLQTYGLQTYPQTEQIKAPPATFRVPCKHFKCQLECLMECHIHACLNMRQVECPVRWLEKMPDRLSSPPQIKLIQITCLVIISLLEKCQTEWQKKRQACQIKCRNVRISRVICENICQAKQVEVEIKCQHISRMECNMSHGIDARMYLSDRMPELCERMSDKMSDCM